MCKLRVWWLYYIGTSHTSTITILWKFLYYQGHHTVTLHSTKCASFEYGDCTHIGNSGIIRCTILFLCTTKVTILWLYIVQNVQFLKYFTNSGRACTSKFLLKLTFVSLFLYAFLINCSKSSFIREFTVQNN